jgi:hypothetical protein
MTTIDAAPLGEAIADFQDALEGVQSVELKMTVPDSQRVALWRLGVDPLDAIVRQVFFFDTPDLSLFERGVVVRARRTQRADDDTVVKLRPAVPSELSPPFRDSANMKIELDATKDGRVISASMKGERRPGTLLQAIAGTRPLPKLFTKEQRTFYAEHVEGVEWSDLRPLGPIAVLRLKFAIAGIARFTAEQWQYPGELPLVELSTKAKPADVFGVIAKVVGFLRSRDLRPTGSQEPKTRKALEFFSKLGSPDGLEPVVESRSS